MPKSHSTDGAQVQPPGGNGRRLNLFGDDRERIIAHLGTTKARLYAAVDPVTSRPVIPGKGEYNTYTGVNVPSHSKDVFRMRLHKETDWVFRFAAHCRLGGLVAVAVGLKVGFEFWYVTELLGNGAWKRGQTQRAALASNAPTEADVDRFAASDFYRETVVPGIVAGLREHLAFSAHPQYIPFFPTLNPATLPSYIKDGIDARWPLLPIFEGGRVCGHLADPQSAVALPNPDQVEWKTVIPKERAGALVDAVMRAVLCCKTEPFGWYDISALAENLAFIKGGNKNGTTVEPSPSAGRHLHKRDCVLVQHSAVAIAERPKGQYLPGITRRKESADGKPRISSGASFLVSVSCAPGTPVPKVEQAIRETLHAKLFQNARTDGTLEPRGILINVMSSKAIPDLSETTVQDRFKDASGKPFEEQPVYVMLVWQYRVDGEPKLKEITSKDSLCHGDTITEDWLPLRALELLDMDLYGERAVLHALLHPGSARVVGNGSAWFLDFCHPDNMEWKRAFARPRQGRDAGDGVAAS